MTVPHITIEQAKHAFTGAVAPLELLKIYNERIDIANAEQEQPLISADEARNLGAGKAEWMYAGGTWKVIGSVHPWFEGCKYRAIKQPEPVESTCQVRNLDTGELKTMTREAAKKLQAEFGDTVDWYFPNGVDFGNHFVAAFKSDGIYTYKLRGTVKLTIDDEPAQMLTPAQCEAERLARVDTHDVQALGGIFKSWSKIGDAYWLPLDAKDYRDDQVQYRLIRKQPKTWTGSREDVMALLNELGLQNGGY